MPKKGQRVQLVVLLQSAWFLKVRYVQSVLLEAMEIFCGFARQMHAGQVLWILPMSSAILGCA